MRETEQLNQSSFELKKRWLKRYSRIVKRIERLEEKLARIDTNLYSCGSGQISDMPKGGEPRTMEDLLVQKEETQERINRLVQTRNKTRKEIVAVIDELEDYRHVEVLEYFFINDYTIEMIAEDFGYTVRHTIRFYSDAINLLDGELCQ